MSGSQKVFLRIVGLIGDGGDPDEMPDRVNVSGRGSLIPTIAAGTGDVAQGPDSLHEIRLVEPVPFEIVDGMLTYDGKPYVWLPVPTGEWMWRVTFDQVWVGERMRELRDFLFPLDAATPAQIADEGYPGVNLAQYGIGAWEPGTVNLTAQAISQITIYLGRASSAAEGAEQSRRAAQQLVASHTVHTDQVTADLAQTISNFNAQLDVTHDHIHLDVEHADTHALAAGTAAQTAITKAGEASDSAGVATTKAGEAAQSRADALTFRNTAQGAETRATTKAAEAVQSALEALTSRDEAEGFRDEAGVSAQTLAQRVSQGGQEIAYTSDGRPYLLDEPQIEVPLTVDTSVGTRVFLGDVMIYGDTGWRSIPLMENWVGVCRVRRMGPFVEARLEDVRKADPSISGTNVVALPVGLRLTNPASLPSTNRVPFVNTNSGGGNEYAYIAANGVYLRVSDSSGNPGNAVFVFAMDQGWPDSLPGDPA